MAFSAHSCAGRCAMSGPPPNEKALADQDQGALSDSSNDQITIPEKRQKARAWRRHYTRQQVDTAEARMLRGFSRTMPKTAQKALGPQYSIALRRLAFERLLRRSAIVQTGTTPALDGIPWNTATLWVISAIAGGAP